MKFLDFWISKRIQSPTFLVEFIEDNIFEVDPGWVDKKSVADGFWVMLPPLEKGEHVIHFRGAYCDGGEPFFDVDVTYQITVLSEKDRRHHYYGHYPR